MHFEQAVHPSKPFFLQRIGIQNNTDANRECRFFFAYDFRIAESDIGDTAYYNPFLNALVHYKRDFYFLIAGYTGDDGLSPSNGIVQYACGIKEFGGAEGAWRDAEDGELSGNSIAQGSVDSVIGLRFHVNANSKTNLRLWLAAGSTLKDVTAAHKYVTDVGFDSILSESEARSEELTEQSEAIDSLPGEIASLYRRSLALTQTHVDARGAIIASMDSDIMQTARAHYAYTWPRDGALVAYALDRAGFTAQTAPFFKFCVTALEDSLEQKFWKQGAALMHKYSPDGTIGSSWHPWVVPGGDPEPPIQEDGSALVVWSTVHHCEVLTDQSLVRHFYKTFVKPASDFMCSHRDDADGLPVASWDIWEERRGIHIYTVAAVVGALTAASRLATSLRDKAGAKTYASVSASILNLLIDHFWDEPSNRFARMLVLSEGGAYIKDMTIDSSAYALFAFGALPADHPKVVATMEAIGRSLWVKTAVGGLARYEKDYYFRVTEDFEKVPGNPWVICTLWLAEWTIARATKAVDLGSALDMLRWASLAAMSTGVLPEQVHPQTREPLSVAPLTWSHAQFITTTLNYLKKRDELS